MKEQKRNTHGLFDIPMRSPEKERVTLTAADIERQLNAGAFLMSREEAIAAGFIHDHDEQDGVVADVVEAKA